MAAPEEHLRQRIREIPRKWLRWGYRRVGAKLRQEGRQVNHKRVHRLWREEGLRVPQRSPKRRRLGQSTVPAQRLQAERPNQESCRPEGLSPDTREVVWAFTRDSRILRELALHEQLTAGRTALLDGERLCERQNR